MLPPETYVACVLGAQNYKFEEERVKGVIVRRRRQINCF